MSLELYLIRHARSNEKLPDQEDSERELTAIGMQNSSRMGRNFYQNSIHPDMIVCSSANRARSTALMIAEQIKFDAHNIIFDEEVYNASVRTLLQVVNNFDDKWRSVFVVGHNPTVSYLAEYVTSAEIGSITTCGVVRIKFSTDSWGEISESSGTMVSYEHPDLLNF